MHPKERAIKEKRTIEATKKKFTSPSGKIAKIAKYLGDEIISHGGMATDVNFLDSYEDFDQVEYEQTLSGQNGPEIFRDSIPEMDDVNTRSQGFHFNGISRGMHLEILYLFESHQIQVLFEGYEVYKEAQGELEAYAPGEEWEKNIVSLANLAEKKSKQINKLIENEKGRKRQEAKKSIWEKIRTRWGL